MANRHFSQKDRKCITLIQKTPVKYLIGNNHFCSLFSSSFFLSLSDTSNVSWMGHFVWSQPHSLHDFRFHANVLHFHAFKDQHSQKQGEKIISCNVLKFLPPSYQQCLRTSQERGSRNSLIRKGKVVPGKMYLAAPQTWFAWQYW